jgi:hypothetical protein
MTTPPARQTRYAASTAPTIAGKPDDTDRPEDEEAAFEAWRLRELQRIKRDLDAEAAVAAEQAETLRRRNLSDAERAREDAELERAGLKVFRKEKKAWGFLQVRRSNGQLATRSHGERSSLRWGGSGTTVLCPCHLGARAEVPPQGCLLH